MTPHSGNQDGLAGPGSLSCAMVMSHSITYRAPLICSHSFLNHSQLYVGPFPFGHVTGLNMQATSAGSAEILADHGPKRCWWQSQIHPVLVGLVDVGKGQSSRLCTFARPGAVE